MIDRPTCATCPYWLLVDEVHCEEVPYDPDEWEEEPSGECKRYPPTRSVYCDGVRAFREESSPYTYPSDWCGEHPLMGEYLRERMEKKDDDP